LEDYDFKKEFSLKVIKEESKERGWLFSVITAWCGIFGSLCILLACVVWVKSIFFKGATAEAIIGLVIVGVTILVSTGMMWKLLVMGRNVAIVLVATMSWVVGSYFGQKTGSGFVPQVFTIVFAAMSISCFTSERVREQFRKRKEELIEMMEGHRE
jgi:hypothetical protein